MSAKRYIFHIDANSAYLSWEAAYRLQHGDPLDLRTVPSVVGGDPATRHGIVLAKSIPAKKYRIQTGETVFSARAKCLGAMIRITLP
jgi:DNA polymerase-4